MVRDYAAFVSDRGPGSRLVGHDGRKYRGLGYRFVDRSGLIGRMDLHYGIGTTFSRYEVLESEIDLRISHHERDRFGAGVPRWNTSPVIEEHDEHFGTFHIADRLPHPCGLNDAVVDVV